MNKKKKQLESFKSELHVISPLPLEMVAERLRGVEAKNRLFHIEQLSDDEFGFVVRRNQAGFLSEAQVLGTIWRWNGTFTRVDVDSKVDILGQWLDVAMQVVGIIVAMLLLTPFFWFFSEILPQALFAPPVAFFLVLIGIGLASVVILTIARMADVDLLSSRRFRALRDVDSMMQAIADNLSENLPLTEPALEFDGSETSLATLLKSEKYQYMQMGEDGEVDTP